MSSESTGSPCEHAHEDGAYVLGALSPEDRLAFERHLPGCADCAQSVRELAGIPGLLARVPVEMVEAGPLAAPVPDTLLPALVRRVRRTERRRTWVTAGLAGIAAAAAVVAFGFATLGNDDGSPDALPPAHSSAPTAPSTAPAEVMRPVGDEPISGWLSLTQVGWGTRLDLTCSYASDSHDYDDPSWSTYAMYVHTADGAVEQVASWRALPGKTMQLAAATAAARADITSVEVRTSSGDRVLELS
jgi:anti-sigma factor RsiW